MPEERMPAVPRELLQWLEDTYKDRCPALDMTDREVWFEAGAASVVKKLRQIHENQLHTAMEKRS